MTTNHTALSSATATDLKAALGYLSIMRELCLNDDGDEISGAVPSAMKEAGHRLSQTQCNILEDLVALARDNGDWEPGFFFTGESGLSGCGTVWSWTINARAPEGHPHSLSIEPEGDGFGVFLTVPGPVDADGTRCLPTVAQAHITRADLLKLVASC